MMTFLTCLQVQTVEPIEDKPVRQDNDTDIDPTIVENPFIDLPDGVRILL